MDRPIANPCTSSSALPLCYHTSSRPDPCHPDPCQTPSEPRSPAPPDPATDSAADDPPPQPGPSRESASFSVPSTSGRPRKRPRLRPPSRTEQMATWVAELKQAVHQEHNTTRATMNALFNDSLELQRWSVELQRASLEDQRRRTDLLEEMARNRRDRRE